MDLLRGPAEIAEALAGLEAGERAPDPLLDAYLLACGLTQLLEDRAGPLAARARQLSYEGPAGRAVHAADSVARLLRAATPAGRRHLTAAEVLAGLVDDLAVAVVSGEEQALPRGRFAEAAAVAAAVSWGGADLLRPPSCFRSFDQRPEDMVLLAERLAGRVPSGPLTLVGVRTSGGYLAPLLGAALSHLGRAGVRVVTLRPGWPELPALRAALCRHREGEGAIVLVDDPPTSGATLASVARRMRHRWPRSRVMAALALLPGSDAALARIGEAAVVALEFEEWDVHRLLRVPEVTKALSSVLTGGETVLELCRLAPAPAGTGRAVPAAEHGAARGHVRADYRVQMLAGDGRRVVRTLRVEGVGLGYLGRQAVALRRRAPELFPPLLGVENGLLLRWLVPGEQPLGAASPARPPSPAALAAHVAARARAFPTAGDRSRGLAGRQPAWEVGGRILGRSLGPLAALHGLLADPLVRRLLTSARPSLVDGDAAPCGYAVAPWGGRAVRLDFGEGPFGHLDLASYDPVFDLAALAARGPAELEAPLRLAYEELTGERLAPERWLVHVLIQHWNERRLGRLGGRAAARASADAVRRFVSALFLADLPPAASGEPCALDLDGVLETSPLGFPATTRAGALALRALRAHGHPLVLVTGRSAGDLARRCADYGAVGGVAEYGAVAYDHRSGRRLELAAPWSESSGPLARLARAVRADGALDLDEDYRYLVRVSLAGDRLAGLPERQVARLLAAAGPTAAESLRAIGGEEQTDFLPAAVGKASGLRAMLVLGGEGTPADRPGAAAIGLAVGDAAADAGFLAMADARFAPANADPALSSVARLTRRRYQAGLSEAVGNYIGHAPGSCPRCRPPRLSKPAADLLALLSLQEDGLEHSPAPLLALAARSLAAQLAPARRARQLAPGRRTALAEVQRR